MAASLSPDARDPLSPDRYTLLHELGSRAVPTFAAHFVAPGANAAKPQLVVVERLVRSGPTTDAEAADFIRDAKRVAELEHPNIARIRDVAIRADDVVVACDFVDGERLSEMWEMAFAGTLKVPLEVTLRILVDVLTGLGALHNLRDVKRQPLKLVHGELTPANVVVGLDGTSRVLHACRVRSAATRPGRTGSGYLAPEILLADGTADQRADVYSVGVILWEALSGKPLFADSNPHTIVAYLLSGRLHRATCPADAPWAAELVPVAERALAADPQKRFGTAAELAAEIRRVAGTKLATTGKVAGYVKSTFGEKIAQRRVRIEGASGLPVAARAPQASQPTSPALTLPKSVEPPAPPPMRARQASQPTSPALTLPKSVEPPAPPAPPPMRARQASQPTSPALTLPKPPPAITQPLAHVAPAPHANQPVAIAKAPQNAARSLADDASSGDGWDIPVDDDSPTKGPSPIVAIPPAAPPKKLEEPRTAPVAFAIPPAAIPPAAPPAQKAPPGAPPVRARWQKMASSASLEAVNPKATLPGAPAPPARVTTGAVEASGEVPLAAVAVSAEVVAAVGAHADVAKTIAEPSVAPEAPPAHPPPPPVALVTEALPAKPSPPAPVANVSATPVLSPLPAPVANVTVPPVAWPSPASVASVSAAPAALPSAAPIVAAPMPPPRARVGTMPGPGTSGPVHVATPPDVAPSPPFFAANATRVETPAFTPLAQPDALLPPTPRRRWPIVVAVLVPCVVLLSWGGCKFLQSDPTSVAATATTPRATVSAPPSIVPLATATAVVSVAEPGEAASTKTTTGVATPTAATTAASSEAPSIDPTAPTAPKLVQPYVAVPPPQKTKPRPTYDPQGI